MDLVLTGFLKHSLFFSETLMLVQIEIFFDIITAGMGNALATDGGFCTGSVRVVDHQVDAEHRFLMYILLQFSVLLSDQGYINFCSV